MVLIRKTNGENQDMSADSNEIAKITHAAVNKLAKWRQVFAGWQLGLRPKGDPEGDAVKHHRELSMLLRAELNAMAVILIEKGVMTSDDYTKAVGAEATLLDRAYEKLFPGFTTVDDGVVIDPVLGAETMKNWRG
jgi:hypothetical protein